MGSRVQGLGAVTAATLIMALAGIAFAATGDTGGMCPPVTIGDLFPEEPETTTTTTVVPDDTAGTTSTTDTTLPPEPPCDTPFVYPMVFPLLGDGRIMSGFGAARDGGRRHHLGSDIAAVKLQPVVAVADGTVTRIAGDTGISGYRIRIRHDDGWRSLYIHLNNDTAGTDDGSGVGIRLDLEAGDRVEAGQIIGWNGDSGNAENTVPHLHFELRDPEGVPVDPGASLTAATRLPEIPFTGPFADLEFGAEPTAMVLLLSRGVPTWCDDFLATACPDDPATAGEVGRWLEGLVGEVDVSPEPQEGEDGDPTDCVTTADCRDHTGQPCEAGCYDPAITEAEVARAMAWGRLRDGFEKRMGWLELGIPDSAWSTPPPRPPAHPYQLPLQRAHEILGGEHRCLALADSENELTRSEASELIVLYLGWAEVANCSTSSANR